MLEQFEDYFSAFIVMTELTSSKDVPVNIRTLYKDENLTYFRIEINKTFAFETMFYPDRLEMPIYLMKYKVDHMKLLDYLNESNFPKKDKNEDGAVHSATYIFREFDDFKKFFARLAEISSLNYELE